MGGSTGNEWTEAANRCTDLVGLYGSWAWANGLKSHGMSAGNMDVGKAGWGDQLGRPVCWKDVIEGWRDWLWNQFASGRKVPYAAEISKDLEIAGRC